MSCYLCDAGVPVTRSKTLNPKDVLEIQQRVAMAWTMAITVKEHASVDEQRTYAQELLNTHTTFQLIDKIRAMRWEHTPRWWRGTHEQFLKHYGVSDYGLQKITH